MSAAYTTTLSVQVSDFEDICLLIQHRCLVCDFCSSDQRFACGFLQIPPRGGHPCRSANTSPCRVCRGLAPPSGCALPGAQKENPAEWPGKISWLPSMDSNPAYSGINHAQGVTLPTSNLQDSGEFRAFLFFVQLRLHLRGMSFFQTISISRVL